jgi:hypothetical protein
MKKLTLFLILVLLPLLIIAKEKTVYNPVYGKSSCMRGLLKIISIENNTDETIIKFKYKDPFAGIGKVSTEINISKDTKLIDNKTKKEYKLRRAIDIPLAPENYKFNLHCDSLIFSLVFDKLPEKTELFNLIENEDSKSGFKFYDITFEPTKELESNILGSNELDGNIKRYGYIIYEDIDTAQNILKAGRAYSSIEIDENTKSITYRFDNKTNKYRYTTKSTDKTNDGMIINTYIVQHKLQSYNIYYYLKFAFMYHPDYTSLPMLGIMQDNLGKIRSFRGFFTLDNQD